MFAESFLVGVVGILFLDLRRVHQQELGEIERCARAIDRAAKAILHEPGKVAGMVDVRMCQEQEIDMLGIESRFLPVQMFQFLEPLEKPRVDQKPRGAGFDQVSRTSDGAGTAVE